MIAKGRRFTLLLAGANWRERLIAGLGAVVGIGLCAAISTLAVPNHGLLLAAPLGASAVLLFAVPSSPLAQPWPIIGGNIVSAVVGVAVAHLLGNGAVAVGVAVGTAILAMSVLRCLHPPGGGTVLLPLLAPAALAQGYGFALLPVGLNAVALTAIGIAFHRISGHSYPHRPMKIHDRPRLLMEDIDAALEESGETFDVSREDLEALLDRAERHAAARRIRTGRPPRT
ncbi:HPP family protein [Sphingomonas psychrotolerans]|uniref:HPP family protein n=1 Tax=Sphingomonas psychrotolerans TaxID=1327635 RepID=A0ABU3N2N4_9SPHN|nr:HPP family protein [Sphingomonas psychrotolerans]MDT8758737.1 HPP family protein [Sphingomonas psychrotolerans]